MEWVQTVTGETQLEGTAREFGGMAEPSGLWGFLSGGQSSRRDVDRKDDAEHQGVRETEWQIGAYIGIQRGREEARQEGKRKCRSEEPKVGGAVSLRNKDRNCG